MAALKKKYVLEFEDPSGDPPVFFGCDTSKQLTKALMEEPFHDVWVDGKKMKVVNHELKPSIDIKGNTIHIYGDLPWEAEMW